MNDTAGDLPENADTADGADSEFTPAEFRVVLLRMLASSHARWSVCGHAPCRRARLCHGRHLTCFDQPFKVDVQRFLDWTDR
jgi:hypothetical protein